MLALFVIAYFVGAFLIALWVDVRWPQLRPTKLIWAALYILLGSLAPMFAVDIVSLFAAATLTFLTGIWFARWALSQVP